MPHIIIRMIVTWLHKSTSLFLGLCILLAHTASVRSSGVLGEPSAKEAFALSPFKLRSTVQSYTGGTYSRYKIEEYLSIEQSRAVVSYELRARTRLRDSGASNGLSPSEPDKEGTIFADGNASTILRRTKSGGTCESLDDLDVLMKILRLDFYNVQIEWRKFVIGPARWLFFFQNNRHLFEANGAALMNNTDGKILNYEYKTRSINGQPLVVGAHFAAQSLATKTEREVIPERMTFSQDGSYIDLKFSQPQSLSGYYEGIEVSQLEVVLDPFAVEPLSGCGEALAARGLGATTMAEIFRGSTSSLVPALASYSFRGEVQISGATKEPLHYKTSVAFDCSLGLMRVDLNESSADVIQSRQILDLNDNVQYLCLERNRGHRFMVNHLQELAKQQSAGCLRVDISSNRGAKFTPGQLLLGADKFAHLGRATVRGIRAKVYEATRSELPFWLESPLAYWEREEGGAPSAKTWSPAHQLAGAFGAEPNKLVTLLYVGDFSPGPAPILLFEVHRVRSDYGATFERRSVKVHNFKWDANSDFSQGSSHSFALGQAPAMSAPVEQARISLLLDTDVPRAAWLEAPPRDRNVALMASVGRQLGLSLSMVSNFQSELVEKGRPGEGFRVALAFQYASYSFEQLKVERLGRGKRILGQSWYISTTSLVQCAMLAGQPRAAAHFAYDPRERFCFVGVATKDTNQAGPFTSAADGPLEIFRLAHSAATSASLSQLLQHTQSAVGDTGQTSRAVQLKLAIGALPSKFTISRLSVYDKEQREEASGSGEAPTSIIRRLTGFGLNEQAKISERLEAVPLRSTFADPFGKGDERHELAEMSLAWCESTCASDPRCQSYSVCVKGARTECVVSQLSFKSRPLVDSIKKLAASSSGRSMQVNVAAPYDGYHDASKAKQNELSISLIRRRNCAIYNKHYLDYYWLELEQASTLFDQSVTLVEDMEQCAALCSRANFRAIRGHFSRLAETLVGLHDGLSAEELEANWVDVKAVKGFNFVRDLSRSMCEQFVYIDQNHLLTERPEMRQVLANAAKAANVEGSNNWQDNSNSTNNNFCAIPKASVQAESGASTSPEPRQHILNLSDSLRVTRAHFKKRNLYEELDGVRLLESEMSLDEQIGFAKLASNEPVEAQVLASVLSFVRRGENHQRRFAADEERCAELCLLNPEAFWPTCKSFDVVLLRDSTTDRTQLWCYLNSVSLNEAISNERQDLIDASSLANCSSDRQVVVERRHYEPRPGFVLELTTFEGEKTFLQLVSERMRAYLAPCTSGSMATLISLLAVVSGVYFGAVLAGKSCRLAGRRFGTRANSLSQAPVIDLHERPDDCDDDGARY